MPNWASHVISSRTNIYDINREFSDGSELHYYIEVDKLKETMLLGALKQGGYLNPAAYGTVIASCVGEPDETLKELLRDKYHADV